MEDEDFRLACVNKLSDGYLEHIKSTLAELLPPHIRFSLALFDDPHRMGLKSDSKTLTNSTITEIIRFSEMRLMLKNNERLH
jgi:hypothetical protein